MITPLNQVLARRMWFVPGVVVWGLPGLGEIDFVAAERVGDTVSILHGSANPGGGEQEIAFADLIDHRGNALPEAIASPRVFLRAANGEKVFVAAAEAPSSFRVARDPGSADTVTADMLVIELGD